MREARRRPAELLVVVALACLSGAIDVVLGVVLVFDRYVPAFEGDGTRQLVTIAGSITILFGFLEVSLATAVARPDRGARVVLSVLLLVGLGLDLLVVGVASDAWYQLIDAAVTVGVIAVLWTGRVARFFARPEA